MPKHVDKPIRLYVITIFVVLAYGLLPLCSYFPAGHWVVLVGPRFLPFNGSVLGLYGPDGEVSIILLIVTLALSFFSVGSSLVTFLGVAEGRIATLIFVTLDVAWWFFLVIIAIMDNASELADRVELVSQMILPPFWLAAVWWNYMRPDISAWLKYMSEVNP